MKETQGHIAKAVNNNNSIMKLGNTEGLQFSETMYYLLRKQKQNQISLSLHMVLNAGGIFLCSHDGQEFYSQSNGRERDG